MQLYLESIKAKRVRLPKVAYTNAFVIISLTSLDY
jgi:hypothetical protein